MVGYVLQYKPETIYLLLVGVGVGVGAGATPWRMYPMQTIPPFQIARRKHANNHRKDLIDLVVSICVTVSSYYHCQS